MRNSERGASVWPFVITLLLLLLFGFLWFQEKGDRETLANDNASLKAAAMRATALEGALRGQLDRTAQVVGFVSKTPPKLKLILGDKTEEVDGGAWVDVDGVAQQLNPDTPGGLLNQLRAKAEVKIVEDLYRPKAGQPPAQKVDLEKLPQGFKDKVKEAIEAFPGAAPPPPVDEDDADAVAKYAAAKSEYEAKLEKYKKVMDELVAMKEWPAFSSVIGATSLYELDLAKPVTWQFWYPMSGNPTTLEEYSRAPALILELVVKSWIEMVNGNLTTIDGLQKTKAALEKTLDNTDEAAKGLKQQLEAEQAAHSADNARLTKEAADAKADAEVVRVKATTAENALAKLEQDSKLDRARSDQEVNALKNRIRTDKEVREIEIQRNDPDGIVLDMNPILAIGYVNLGSADKVYPGLKFEVSAIGRGGIRSPKGEVMITKVIDAHYSQVRLVSTLSADRPVGKGDLIANPFYNKSRPMRVYLAGELRKYPRAIAVERLGRMGVIVEDKISDKTDYVVIPDTVSVGAPAAAPEGEAAAPAAESEFDRLQRLARTFGATLITERMIESLLDY